LNWGLGLGIGDWGLGSYRESLCKMSSQVTIGFCRCETTNEEKWLILLNKVGTCEIIYGNPG